MLCPKLQTQEAKAFYWLDEGRRRPNEVFTSIVAMRRQQRHPLTRFIFKWEGNNLLQTPAVTKDYVAADD